MPSAEERYLQIISGQATGPAAACARAALQAAETPFRAVVALRGLLYDCGLLASHPLGRPVISVGNLTAGGTGKTPVVQWLARRLLADHRHPAILTRGYRKGASTLSDEAMLLAESLPGVRVQVNADRVAGAASALAEDATLDCFLLDDGLQHRRVRRDADLVLINARSPFGYGHLHPRGLLREPLGAMARATAILITHASEVPPGEVAHLQETIRRYTPAPIFHADHRNTSLQGDQGPAPLELLEQHRFIAFAGIGNPSSLEAQLRRFGDRFAGSLWLGDHHDYTPGDLERLAARCREAGARAMVTTEKDWSKVRSLPRPEACPPFYRLGLTVAFWEGEEELLYSVLMRSSLARRANATA